MVSKSKPTDTLIKGKEPYATLKKRLDAIGEPISDPTTDFLAGNAETLF